LRESEPQELNLLQFYSYCATSHFGNGKVNVLLLYLSPQDSDELIPELQKEVQEKFKNIFASFNFCWCSTKTVEVFSRRDIAERI